MTSAPASLRIDRSSLSDGTTLVTPHGVLDLSSYAQLRDLLLKSALELPKAVVVDLAWLRVPTDATLAVFSSVWMQVSDWPGVPIVLVAPHQLDLRRLRRSSITRLMPVYPSLDEALASLSDPPPHRRSMLELPQVPASIATARRFVEVTCIRWDCEEIFPDAVLIASELVENAIRHARGEPKLRLELRSSMLTVAVYDDDPTPARLVDPEPSTRGHLGLQLVDRLANTWNCAPTMSGGKVVWAVLRLTNRPGPRGVTYGG